VTSLEAALRQIHTDLTDVHVAFALVGGLAVSARPEPRFTRGADLAVASASDAEAEALIHVDVARTGHLIALKVLSRHDVTRPQDFVDLRALLRVASATELAQARESVMLIEARGYPRGRDLLYEMNQLTEAPR